MTKNWITDATPLNYTTECTTAAEMLERDALVDAALKWRKLHIQVGDYTSELTDELWDAYNSACYELIVATDKPAVRRAMKDDGDDGEGVP